MITFREWFREKHGFAESQWHLPAEMLDVAFTRFCEGWVEYYGERLEEIERRREKPEMRWARTGPVKLVLEGYPIHIEFDTDDFSYWLYVQGAKRVAYPVTGSAKAAGESIAREWDRD